MRHPTICCLLTCILFAQSLPAQTGDWNAVISIPSGTIVTVRIDRGSIHCTLASVTASELMCYREPRRFDTTPANYVIARSKTIQVRREYRRGIKMAAGAGIGAATGAGIGAAIDTKDAQTRAVGAGVGVLAGSLVGLIVGSLISHSGMVVYER